MKYLFLLLIPFLIFPQSITVVSGGYTGNGVNPTSITGLGIEPKILFIKADGTGEGKVKLDVQGTSMTNSWDAVVNDSSIVSLDSDGFTITDSTSVNENTTAYNYIAMTGSSDYLETGTYTGNGNDNRDISITGSFEIGLLMIFSDDANAATVQCYRCTGTHTGDQTTPFRYQIRANAIQSLGTGTFQIGTDAHVNNNGTTYYYLAVANNSNFLEGGTYTGSGGDDSTVVLTNSIDPDWIVIKKNADNVPIKYQSDYIFATYGDRAYANTIRNHENNNIQTFTTGSFQLGSDNDVNQASIVYLYFVLGSYTAPSTDQEKGYNKYKHYNRYSR